MVSGDPGLKFLACYLQYTGNIDAHTWFRWAEVQFLLNVTSPTTQADHILSALPHEIFPQIYEWLISTDDRPIGYGVLKTFLLQRFSPSAASRVTQLLQLVKHTLGDQRSFDALLQMKALARPHPAADTSVRQLDLPYGFSTSKSPFVISSRMQRKWTKEICRWLTARTTHTSLHPVT